MIETQCYYESNGNPNAVSKKGALGLCQFMPATWNEVSAKYFEMGLNNPFDPVQSLLAAHIYMNELYSRLDFVKNDIDRYKLALASYNAGYSNIMAARKKAKKSNFYNEIMAELYQVTGYKNSHITKKYVKNIWEEVKINYDT